jgi:hypothetical protein
MLLEMIEGFNRNLRGALCVAVALVLSSGPIAQRPEAVGENLLRLEGTDAPTGIHYLKLMLLLKGPDTPADAAPATLPRFTVECREQKGKRSLHWLLRLDGSENFGFYPPGVLTEEHPYPTPTPNVLMSMRFEGYTHSQEFKRQWEVLPTGELHYRNAGIRSANLDDPVYFMQWLGSLPNLRIGYAKPTATQPKAMVFATKPLLELVKKAALCQQ